jgi:hypothetical protein
MKAMNVAISTMASAAETSFPASHSAKLRDSTTLLSYDAS